MFRVTFIVTNVELVIVHYSRLLKLPSERNCGRRGSNSFRSAHDFRPSRVSNNHTSSFQVSQKKDHEKHPFWFAFHCQYSHQCYQCKLHLNHSGRKTISCHSLPIGSLTQLFTACLEHPSSLASSLGEPARLIASSFVMGKLYR